MNSSNDPNTFIGADNQIADLLAAPFIRDAQEIVWYAAGAQHTWLTITKTNGQTDIQAFKRDKTAFGKSEFPLEEFSHRFLRPDPADARGLTEDLSRNHYAVSQLAMVNYDAWDRNDWAVHNATLGLLAQHVPSVAAVCERAKTIDAIEGRPDQMFKFAIGQAMRELDAIEALSDDPKGLATLDPWFRAQQLIRVASKAQPDTVEARRVALYSFESEDEKSFLLVSPDAGDVGGFNLWLDGDMRPLFVDYLDTGTTAWLEKPGTTWELHRPYPGTLSGWNNAMMSMGLVNDSPFESLAQGAMQTLSPQETLDAILAWARNPEPMAVWDGVDDPSALARFGAWAMQTWTWANPQSGQLLTSLLPHIEAGAAPSEFDAWRQLLAMEQKKNPDADVGNVNLDMLL